MDILLNEKLYQLLIKYNVRASTKIYNNSPGNCNEIGPKNIRNHKKMGPVTSNITTKIFYHKNNH